MRSSDRAYIGFSCDPETKKKAVSIARHSGNASLGSVCRIALKSYISHWEYSTQEYDMPLEKKGEK